VTFSLSHCKEPLLFVLCAVCSMLLARPWTGLHTRSAAHFPHSRCPTRCLPMCLPWLACLLFHRSCGLGALVRQR